MNYNVINQFKSVLKSQSWPKISEEERP